MIGKKRPLYRGVLCKLPLGAAYFLKIGEE